MRYIIGLLCFVSVAFSQITDENFRDKTGDGFTVIVFTSEWQENDLDEKLLKGIDGHEDAVVIYAKGKETKKICKKLRIRNFPSLALFFDGSKKEVWKADMDGEIDVSSKEIKNAIDDVLAEDVF
tara:strand:+ start:500 stop:874 length:375 start_codon:yes stop_codon:yes gene_type:complete